MLTNPHFQRIGSNYLRMSITFVIGVWLLQLFLGFGEEVYAVIVLTGSSIGIAEILKETIRGATVPELGKSYHSNEDTLFDEIYSSTILLSLVSACFSALVLFLFIFFLHHFNIPENLIKATQLYITTRIVCVFLSIALAPVHNMMPITGRMISYNVWLTMDRAVDLISALTAAYLLIGKSGAEQLIVFSIVSLILKLVVLLLSTAWSTKYDERFIPNYKLVSTKHVAKVGRMIGWNAAAVISVNLYLRFDIIAINLLYGVKATVIFGLASQLAAYVNISSMGFVSGLDAVVTQLSKRGIHKQKRKVFSISKSIVELQALVFGIILVVLSLHTDSIISMLFSEKLDAHTDINTIIVCFFLLMIGMFARGISEGWMGILTGMGNIKAYAIPVLVGASLNPILVCVIGNYYELEEGLIYTSGIFLTLNVFFHMYYIPKVTAVTLEVGTADLVKPVLIPTVLTILAITIAYSIGKFASHENIKLLITIVVAIITLGIYFLIRVLNFLSEQSEE